MFRHGGSPIVNASMPPETDTPIVPPTPRPTPTPAPTPAPIPPGQPTPSPTPEPTPVPRVIRQEFLDYRAHYNNDEIVGRVWVPNTTIDYLVTQGTDNVFYLYFDIRGRRSAPGWVFLDYTASIHGQDQNWVIYGHNMAANHRFNNVRRFIDRDFFFNNRYIYFSTIYADYVFEVFSSYITHKSFPYIYANFDQFDGGWEHWIHELASRSFFDAGIEVSADDRIITLSTCYQGNADYRIPVHGRLISMTFPHLDGDPDGDE